MDEKRLSVIIPVYNAKDHLKECINSVINQTYQNLEIIIIDDGSTDGSFDICREYVSDSRVIVIRQNNQGVCKARNTGKDASTGDYITFVDADDVLEPDTYLFAMTVIESLDLDLVVFDSYTNFGNGTIELINPSLSLERVELIEEKEKYRNFLDKTYIGTTVWNKVWRSKCIKKVEFNSDFIICEDAVFVWDSLKYVKKIAKCYIKLYHYRVTDANTTHSADIEKYLSAIKAWDYLKEEAQKQNNASIEGVCKSRLRWAIKTADNLDRTTNIIKLPLIREIILEDDKYISKLPMYERISGRLIRSGHYAFFKFYSRSLLFIKKVVMKRR